MNGKVEIKKMYKLQKPAYQLITKHEASIDYKAIIFSKGDIPAKQLY